MRRRAMMEEDILNKLTYGVQWFSDMSDPHLIRIGNMTYHKTLPIQSKMKGCVYNPKNKEVVYWLDDEDWRFTKTPREVITPELFKYVECTDIGEGPFTEPGVTFRASFNYAGSLGEESRELHYIGYLYMINKDFKVIYDLNSGGGSIDVKIDFIGVTTTLEKEAIREFFANNYTTNGETPIFKNCTAKLDGYDGEVMVYVPEFWIKSWDEADKKSVRISPVRIDDTWEHQPALFIGAYKDTILNAVPEDMGYLSTLEVNSAVSIVNGNSYCRGGGNRADYDQYYNYNYETSSVDKFRSDLGKPRTSISRGNFRIYARKSGKEILSYRQYKNVLYWLYVIEYANFNCQEAYNAELTDNGYHQGGLGNGVTNVSNWQAFNGYYPITPCGYGNDMGNGTGVKLITSPGLTPANGVYMCRWRGFDNPFGDIMNNVDGIIINSSSIDRDEVKYNEIYTTDNPEFFSDSNWQAMEKVGEEYDLDGYIKEWDLGDTAEIIPKSNGGASTQYKCDYHYTNIDTGLRTLILGGRAVHGSAAGLGRFDSYYGMGYSAATVGFRSVCNAL